MPVAQSYFQLFDLPQCYPLDLNRLEQSYRSLQASVHPDRFVTEGAQARRLAEQYSGLLNQAYATLKSPVERAGYLLQLLGVEVDSSTTISDADFLFRQMALREELDAVRQQHDTAALAVIRQNVMAEQQALQLAFSQAVMSETRLHLDAALQIFRKMQFFQKFLKDLNALEDALLD